MQLNLEDKSAVITGLPDSGKSTLANAIIKPWGDKALVYDPMHEYPLDAGYDVFRPQGDRFSVPQLEAVIRAMFQAHRYKLFVLDEANRFCPSKPAPLPQAVADLNDFRAHYGLATMYICRRPVQLNQDLSGLAEYLLSFRLPGKPDRQHFNDISEGLGETVRALEKYHFVMADGERRFKVCSPVDPQHATHKKRK